MPAVTGMRTSNPLAGEPGTALEQQQFWKVFELCLTACPRSEGAFMMREYVGLEASEVCAELAITTTNLHVMLYRARLRLRECLENRWFCAEEQHDELR